jgi:hypothetical protein
LSGGQGLVRTAATLEQALAKPAARLAQVVVERLTRHLGQLEPDGSAGLALADSGAVDGVAVRRHVIDAERHQIAASQLAVDGEVEQHQVTRAPLELQPGSDAPDVTGSKRRLRTGELAFLARRLSSGRRWRYGVVHLRSPC